MRGCLVGAIKSSPLVPVISALQLIMKQALLSSETLPTTPLPTQTRTNAMLPRTLLPTQTHTNVMLPEKLLLIQTRINERPRRTRLLIQTCTNATQGRKLLPILIRIRGIDETVIFTGRVV